MKAEIINIQEVIRVTKKEETLKIRDLP